MEMVEGGSWLSGLVCALGVVAVVSGQEEIAIQYASQFAGACISTVNDALD